MHWKTKHNITITLWALLIGCVPTGIIIALSKAWWELYVLPMIGLTIAQVIELPILDVAAGIMWFFMCPPLLVFAITCIIAGFTLFMEIEW